MEVNKVAHEGVAMQSRQVGQLYIVRLKARKPESRETLHGCWVITGTSREDVERKLPYVIDMAGLIGIKVAGIDRVKPNAHCVYMRLRQDDEPSTTDIVTETAEGTIAHETRTNQPANRAAFRVAIDVTVHANDDQHALRRVGAALAVSGIGPGKPAPWFDGGWVVAEPIGEGTSHTRQTYDNVYTHTSVIGLRKRTRDW